MPTIHARRARDGCQLVLGLPPSTNLFQDARQMNLLDYSAWQSRILQPMRQPSRLKPETSPWCWSLGRMQIFTRVSPACVCPGPCPPFASTSQRTTSFCCLDQDQPLSPLQYNAPRGRTSQADINASIPNLIIHCQDPARSPILVHPRSLLVSSFPFCASKIRHLPLTP